VDRRYSARIAITDAKAETTITTAKIIGITMRGPYAQAIVFSLRTNSQRHPYD
jgi:hypothetical protein